MNKHEVVRDLRKRQRPNETAKAFAGRIGISPQYLSDLLTGRRYPGERVLKFMGLVEEVRYVRKAAK